MGTRINNVASLVFLICCSFVIITFGQDRFDVSGVIRNGENHNHRNGKVHEGVELCKCPACMIGDDCTESVADYEPKFSNRFTYVEVNDEHHKHGRQGPHLFYNHTTYPNPYHCPCPVFVYSITDVEDVMSPENTESFRMFDIDNMTGRIWLSEDTEILPDTTYRLTVTVRNTKTNAADSTMLTVGREVHDGEDPYSFKQDVGNGYRESSLDHHKIHKRSLMEAEGGRRQESVDASGVIRKSENHRDWKSNDGAANCKCPACMIGDDCTESVAKYEPRFSNRFTYVEVNDDHHKHGRRGPHLFYNSTTYSSPYHCPCPVFEYSITDVEDVMTPENPDRFGMFDIDNMTGRIWLSEKAEILPATMYRLTITVRNKQTNAADTTMVTVAREVHDSETNPFKTDVGNGYGDSSLDHHSIHRRSVIPATEVNFTLTQTNSVVDIRVGTRVTFRLDILFPVAPVDMQVELFAPDNVTTVMILCNVVVNTPGSNLAYNGSGIVVYDAKPGYSASVQPDRATINFGTVTNNNIDQVNVAASTISITYEAIMIENNHTANTTYWVSAGAEYQSQNYIWVGQASFTAIVDGNMTVNSDPVFNVTMPATMALGSTHIVNVDMFIPYPTRDYTFKVFTPADTIGVMSICGIWFGSFGPNFACGNDKSKMTNTTQEDPQSNGNALGVLDLGILLNKGSRDASPVVQDNRVSLSFIAHMYPDTTKIGQTLSLGIALEVDTDIMWIGNSNFNVAAAVTTGLTNPTLFSQSTSLNVGYNNAVVGQPFTITYTLDVPLPNTPGVASRYVLELLAPYDGQPIFSVCSFKVTFVGADFPCLQMNDFVTDYSSPNVNSSEPYRAVIDLGYIINMNLWNAGNSNKIIVEAILKPLSSHASNTVSSSHAVTLGVTVGASNVVLSTQNVVIGSAATVTPITNTTAPVFSMSYFDGIDVIPVTGSTKVLITMTTARNITYDAFDMEFLMPTGTDYTYFHVCRAEIVSSGKNMPCMTPKWYKDKVQYLSQFDDYQKDRAKLTLADMCNYGGGNAIHDDETSFALYLAVLDRPDLITGTSKWISSGLQYSANRMWVGQIKLNTTRNINVAPVNSTYVIQSRNTTTSPIPIGLTVSYSLLIKIGRGDKAHLRVKATSNGEGALICTVRVKTAGSNLPCVSDETVTRTYTYWPSRSGYQQVIMDAGVITNYGSKLEAMTPNNYFDADGIIVEVLVRANPASVSGMYPFDINIYYDTGMTWYSSFSKTDFVITEDVSSISTTVPTAVTTAMSIGEITGGDTSANVAIGEAKRVLISAVIPEGTQYDLEFVFYIPTADVGKIEICDAAIVSVGDNLPCIDPLMEAVFIATDTIYVDTAKFNLRYTCSRPIRPGDLKANTVVFEAYVRVLPNGLAAIGNTVTVIGTLRTFSNTVTVNSIVFTVTDPAAFVDRASNLDGVTNETLISLNQPTTITMTIGQNLTINATVSVPQNSVSKFLFDVELPVDDSACLTVSDVRVIGSVGRNVLCIPPSINNQMITYTPIYNSSLDNGQDNYVFLDLGIVTNTGLTHRRKTYVPGDDDVYIEIDIQMADCALNDNSTIHKLSIGNKVANYIFIYDHDVQVFRDGLEKPDFVFQSSVGVLSTSTVLFFEGIVYHSTLSTAEGKNTSVYVYLPNYQLAPGSFYFLGNKSCVIIPDASHTSLLEILCTDFFFVDILHFTAEIQINSSVVLPASLSSSNSIAHCLVGTYYVIRYTNLALEDWYPYPLSGAHNLPYSITAGLATGCSDPMGLSTGSVLDCQIFSSSENLVAGPATSGRLNGAGAWAPYIRDGGFAKNRFFAVYYGSVFRFNQLAVQQNAGYPHLVTEVTVDYTSDGQSWFAQEVVSLGAAPATLVTVNLGRIDARGIRISISNDTSGGVKSSVGMKFEVYGCIITADTTPAGACAEIADPTIVPADFGSRSFVVGATASVYVCDRVVNSKTYKGSCETSSDSGATWKKMDPRLACMIGFESSQNRIYAYAQDRQTIMMSELSSPWKSVKSSVLAADKLLPTWVAAIKVPETASVELDRPTPHAMYTQAPWGATYTGMYQSNVIKLKWAA